MGEETERDGEGRTKALESGESGRAEDKVPEADEERSLELRFATDAGEKEEEGFLTRPSGKGEQVSLRAPRRGELGWAYRAEVTSLGGDALNVVGEELWEVVG